MASYAFPPKFLIFTGHIRWYDGSLDGPMTSAQSALWLIYTATAFAMKLPQHFYRPSPLPIPTGIRFVGHRGSPSEIQLRLITPQIHAVANRGRRRGLTANPLPIRSHWHIVQSQKSQRFFTSQLVLLLRSSGSVIAAPVSKMRPT